MTRPVSLIGGYQKALVSHKRRYGGIGRLGGFRFPCQKRKGSSPFTGTNAEIAQKMRALAERVEVVGSNPTFRNTRV